MSMGAKYRTVKSISTDRIFGLLFHRTEYDTIFIFKIFRIIFYFVIKADQNTFQFHCCYRLPYLSYFLQDHKHHLCHLLFQLSDHPLF
jgi:hypothetical protein